MKPTCKQIWDEELELVEEYADPSWRHGVYQTNVYYRESDSTYWKAHFCVSTDHETNGLREGDASIIQVYPKEVLKTVFSEEKP